MADNRTDLLSTISDLSERTKAEPTDPNLPRLLAEAESMLAALDAAAPAPAPAAATPDTPHATVQGGGVARAAAPTVAAADPVPPAAPVAAPAPKPAPAPVAAPAPAAPAATVAVPTSQATVSARSTRTLGTKIDRPAGAFTADSKV